MADDAPVARRTCSMDKPYLNRECSCTEVNTWTFIGPRISRFLGYVLDYLFTDPDKYVHFQARARPMAAKVPAEKASPQPPVISVRRCRSQQQRTAEIVRMDDNDVVVRKDSQTSRNRTSRISMHNSVLTVWNERSSLETLRNKTARNG